MSESYINKIEKNLIELEPCLAEFYELLFSLESEDFPEVLIFLDTGARPACYILEPILKYVSELKGFSVPKIRFLSTIQVANYNYKVNSVEKFNGISQDDLDRHIDNEVTKCNKRGFGAKKISNRQIDKANIMIQNRLREILAGKKNAMVVDISTLQGRTAFSVGKNMRTISPDINAIFYTFDLATFTDRSSGLILDGFKNAKVKQRLTLQAASSFYAKMSLPDSQRRQVIVEYPYIDSNGNVINGERAKSIGVRKINGDMYSHLIPLSEKKDLDICAIRTLRLLCRKAGSDFVSNIKDRN